MYPHDMSMQRADTLEAIQRAFDPASHETPAELDEFDVNELNATRGADKFQRIVLARSRATAQKPSKAFDVVLIIALRLADETAKPVDEGGTGTPLAEKLTRDLLITAGRGIQRAGRPRYPRHAVQLRRASVILFPKYAATI